MSRPPDKLLSTFRIVRPPGIPGKTLLRCPRLRDRGQRVGLSIYTDRLGRGKYDEKDLEEWIARSPEAIFSHRPIVLLAAEKYGRLDARASADLLFVDPFFQFHVVETKVPTISKKRGVSCSSLHAQMQRYVSRLESISPGFPRSLWSHYHCFSQKFYGYRRNLTMQLATAFGHQVATRQRCGAPFVWQIYVAEGFDEEAIDYFQRRVEGPICGVRLVYYRYYPERQYIEFWEVPIS
ncbi:MAG: hypothetical protein ACFCD0_18730 [Gemmataceae bacterium]